MVYTVYKTTNNINQKFYIGVHKTDNINDDYLGSGKLIKRAISKYGFNNFKKEIIASFDTASQAYALEKILPSDNILHSNLCYNLKQGGEGGFDYLNLTGKNTQRDMTNNRKGGLARYKKYGQITNSNTGWKQSRRFLRKKHSNDTREKISCTMKGRNTKEQNSQFGTFWINNGIVSKKCKGILPIGWVKGRIKMHAEKDLNLQPTASEAVALH